MIVEASEIKNLIGDKRLMALDVSKKFIGIAISDSGLSLASPHSVIERKKFLGDVEKIKKVIADNNIGGIVIGLPVNIDGSEGARCQSVRQFADNISEHIKLPITFQDESLTTFEAKNSILQRKTAHLDKFAAAYILQDTLNKIS